MIKPEQRQVLEQLAQNPVGVKFLAYLRDELEETNDVTIPKTWDEVLKRKGKAQFILQIFKHTKTEMPTVKPKSQYE